MGVPWSSTRGERFNLGNEIPDGSVNGTTYRVDERVAEVNAAIDECGTVLEMAGADSLCSLTIHNPAGGTLIGIDFNPTSTMLVNRVTSNVQSDS